MIKRRLELRRSSLAFHGGGERHHQDALNEALAERSIETLRTILLDDELVDTNDCLHIWNIQDPREAAAASVWAIQHGLPTIVTPLAADRSMLCEGERLAQRVMNAQPSDLAATLRAYDNGNLLAEVRESLRKAPLEPAAWHSLRIQILQNARIVHCLSRSEAIHVARRYGVPRERLVLSGVAPSPKLPALLEKVPTLSEGYVLVPASRLETLKNQLGVALAAHKLEMPIVIAGEAHDPRYASLCRSLAPDNVRFIGLHSRAEFLSIMQRARVVLHPSFLECASLALMDAAALACNLVVSPTTSEREYFGETARYVDPRSPRDIAAATREAWEHAEDEWEERKTLAMRIRQHDWAHAADPLARQLHACC